MKLKTFAVSMFMVFLWASTGWTMALVEAEWLKERLDDKNIRIVDVQDKHGDYDKDHIVGAVRVKRYIDLGDITDAPPSLYPTKEQFEKLMSKLGINKDTMIVAYDNRAGLFGIRLLLLAEYYGHDPKKLAVLNGGLTRWKALGFPATKDPVTVKPTKYAAEKARDDLRVRYSDIYRDVVMEDKPNVLLLDVRPAAEYTAKSIRSIRGGYIPKAINVTGTDANKKEDFTFKSVDEIRKMYEEKGITPDKTIYIYCHSGDRVSHAYFTLKYLLGYKNVKFYDGSWIEWSTILSLPAEGQVWLWEAPKEEKK